MTASDFARRLRARRVGKDKWVALCPSHPDRTPSLSISAGRRGVVIRCMSAGCDTRNILDAMKLRFTDLFYDAATPAARAQGSLRNTWEDLEHELGLVVCLEALEPAKFRYWLAAEKRIRGEIDLIRCKLEPLKVYREWRGRVWQQMSYSQKQKHLEEAWLTLSSKEHSTK